MGGKGDSLAFFFPNSNLVFSVYGLSYTSQQSYELKNRYSFRYWAIGAFG